MTKTLTLDVDDGQTFAGQPHHDGRLVTHITKRLAARLDTVLAAGATSASTRAGLLADLIDHADRQEPLVSQMQGGFVEVAPLPATVHRHGLLAVWLEQTGTGADAAWIAMLPSDWEGPDGLGSAA